MFSVTIFKIDHYSASPISEIDGTYSLFRGSEIRQVPVLRIFGANNLGQKTCLHIHGVFPYLYVPYDGNTSNENGLCHQLAASIDKAINISLTQATSNQQHVHEILPVAQIPFYGYHQRKHKFLKISFYNPSMIKKAANLLQSGAILNKIYQPHEAHIDYELQFMMDYNLHGMKNVNISRLKFRQDPENTDSLKDVDDSLILPKTISRLSTCEIEADVSGSDILNRHEIAMGKLTANPGINALWEEERERRRLMNFTSQITPESSQTRKKTPTASELFFISRLENRLQSVTDSNETDVTIDSTGNISVYPAETQSDEEDFCGSILDNTYDKADDASDVNVKLVFNFSQTEPCLSQIQEKDVENLYGLLLDLQNINPIDNDSILSQNVEPDPNDNSDANFAEKVDIITTDNKNSDILLDSSDILCSSKSNDIDTVQNVNRERIEINFDKRVNDKIDKNSVISSSSSDILRSSGSIYDDTLQNTNRFISSRPVTQEKNETMIDVSEYSLSSQTKLLFNETVFDEELFIETSGKSEKSIDSNIKEIEIDESDSYDEFDITFNKIPQIDGMLCVEFCRKSVKFNKLDMCRLRILQLDGLNDVTLDKKTQYCKTLQRKSTGNINNKKKLNDSPSHYLFVKTTNRAKAQSSSINFLSSNLTIRKDAEKWYRQTVACKFDLNRPYSSRNAMLVNRNVNLISGPNNIQDTKENSKILNLNKESCKNVDYSANVLSKNSSNSDLWSCNTNKINAATNKQVLKNSCNEIIVSETNETENLKKLSNEMNSGPKRELNHGYNGKNISKTCGTDNLKQMTNEMIALKTKEPYNMKQLGNVENIMFTSYIEHNKISPNVAFNKETNFGVFFDKSQLINRVENADQLKEQQKEENKKNNNLCENAFANNSSSNPYTESLIKPQLKQEYVFPNIDLSPNSTYQDVPQVEPLDLSMNSVMAYMKDLDNWFDEAINCQSNFSVLDMFKTPKNKDKSELLVTPEGLKDSNSSLNKSGPYSSKQGGEMTETVICYDLPDTNLLIDKSCTQHGDGNLQLVYDKDDFINNFFIPAHTTENVCDGKANIPAAGEKKIDLIVPKSVMKLLAEMISAIVLNDGNGTIDLKKSEPIIYKKRIVDFKSGARCEVMIGSDILKQCRVQAYRLMLSHLKSCNITVSCLVDKNSQPVILHSLKDEESAMSLEHQLKSLQGNGDSYKHKVIPKFNVIYKDTDYAKNKVEQKKVRKNADYKQKKNRDIAKKLNEKQISVCDKSKAIEKRTKNNSVKTSDKKIKSVKQNNDSVAQNIGLSMPDINEEVKLFEQNDSFVNKCKLNTSDQTPKVVCSIDLTRITPLLTYKTQILKDSFKIKIKRCVELEIKDFGESANIFKNNEEIQLQKSNKKCIDGDLKLEEPVRKVQSDIRKDTANKLYVGKKQNSKFNMKKMVSEDVNLGESVPNIMSDIKKNMKKNHHVKKRNSKFNKKNLVKRYQKVFEDVNLGEHVLNMKTDIEKDTEKNPHVVKKRDNKFNKKNLVKKCQKVSEDMNLGESVPKTKIDIKKDAEKNLHVKKQDNKFDKKNLMKKCQKVSGDVNLKESVPNTRTDIVKDTEKNLPVVKKQDSKFNKKNLVKRYQKISEDVNLGEYVLNTKTDIERNTEKTLHVKKRNNKFNKKNLVKKCQKVSEDVNLGESIPNTKTDIKTDAERNLHVVKKQDNKFDNKNLLKKCQKVSEDANLGESVPNIMSDIKKNMKKNHHVKKRNSKFDLNLIKKCTEVSKDVKFEEFVPNIKTDTKKDTEKGLRVVKKQNIKFNKKKFVKKCEKIFKDVTLGESFMKIQSDIREDTEKNLCENMIKKSDQSNVLFTYVTKSKLYQNSASSVKQKRQLKSEETKNLDCVTTKIRKQIRLLQKVNDEICDGENNQKSLVKLKNKRGNSISSNISEKNIVNVLNLNSEKSVNETSQNLCEKKESLSGNIENLSESATPERKFIIDRTEIPESSENGRKRRKELSKKFDNTEMLSLVERNTSFSSIDDSCCLFNTCSDTLRSFKSEVSNIDQSYTNYIVTRSKTRELNSSLSKEQLKITISKTIVHKNKKSKLNVGANEDTANFDVLNNALLKNKNVTPSVKNEESKTNLHAYGSPLERRILKPNNIITRSKSKSAEQSNKLKITVSKTVYHKKSKKNKYVDPIETSDSVTKVERSISDLTESTRNSELAEWNSSLLKVDDKPVCSTPNSDPPLVQIHFNSPEEYRSMISSIETQGKCIENTEVTKKVTSTYDKNEVKILRAKRKLDLKVDDSMQNRKKQLSISYPNLRSKKRKIPSIDGQNDIEIPEKRFRSVKLKEQGKMDNKSDEFIKILCVDGLVDNTPEDSDSGGKRRKIKKYKKSLNVRSPTKLKKRTKQDVCIKKSSTNVSEVPQQVRSGESAIPHFNSKELQKTNLKRTDIPNMNKQSNDKNDFEISNNLSDKLIERPIIHEKIICAYEKSEKDRVVDVKQKNDDSIKSSSMDDSGGSGDIVAVSPEANIVQSIVKSPYKNTPRKKSISPELLTTEDDMNVIPDKCNSKSTDYFNLTMIDKNELETNDDRREQWKNSANSVAVKYDLCNNFHPAACASSNAIKIHDSTSDFSQLSVSHNDLSNVAEMFDDKKTDLSRNSSTIDVDDELTEENDEGIISFYDTTMYEDNKNASICMTEIDSKTSEIKKEQKFVNHSHNKPIKNESKIFSNSSSKRTSISLVDKDIILIPKYGPPTYSEVKSTMENFGIPENKCRSLHYSNPNDVTGRMEVGNKVLKIMSSSVNDLPEFESQLELNSLEMQRLSRFGSLDTTQNINNDNLVKLFSTNREVTITPSVQPPSRRDVELWIKAKKYIKETEKPDKTMKKKIKISVPLSPDNDSDSGDSLTLSPCTPTSSHSFHVSDSLQSTPKSHNFEILNALQKTPKSHQKCKISDTEKSPVLKSNTYLKVKKRQHLKNRNLRVSLSKSFFKSAKLPTLPEGEYGETSYAQKCEEYEEISCAQKTNDSSSESLTNSQDTKSVEFQKSNDTSSAESDLSMKRLLARSSFVNKLGTPTVGNDSSCLISAATLNNTHGFQMPLENLQTVKSIVEYKYLTILIMELHIRTRGELRPNPYYDPIMAVFYTIHNDVPEQFKLPRRETGIICSETSGEKNLLSGTGIDAKVTYVDSELQILDEVVKLLRKWDPDILAGYEIEMLSWGYLLERGFVLGCNLASKLSRIPESRFNTKLDDKGQMTDMNLAGRVVLDVWRLMRHEIALYSYSFENIIYHVLHQRVAKHSFKNLTFWYEHNTNLYRWITVQYYLLRVEGILKILDQLDLIGRTCELASLFGIQFYEVLSRGSQFRVESMMLRLAKPLSFVPVSPSIQQRAKMKAPEFIPLVMEPESRLYTDPVIVLDFQSLYPSIIIAYNYCFSTCLGQVDLLGQSVPFEFGASQLKIKRNLIENLLKRNRLNISPCGVAFVDKTVRQGILPRMLQEILDTRLMVKKSMKQHKDNVTLQRVLHSRQLGLKLIANVTYGYTAANFSGRMPCMEVGDSVVSKGRETLERAIKLVEQNEKWRAKVIYGDTDSIFVLVPGRSRKSAFEIGAEIADAVTNDNPTPVKLKLEKIYQPCILQTKKRYVGYMYESPDQNEPEYSAKGIETVRRDGCPAVAKMLEKTLRLLFESNDMSLVKQYVCRQFKKLLMGRVNLQDLIFAKEFRGFNGYRPGAMVPSLELARRYKQQDPRAEPRRSERVPYIITSGPPGEILVRLARGPHELLADSGLHPHILYYITRVIIPPLNRCLMLCGADAGVWFNEMPRKQNTLYHHSTSLKVDFPKKSTLSQHFVMANCASCSIQTRDGLCLNCIKQPQRTAVVLSSKLERWERTYAGIKSICQSCCGRPHEISCESSDCPVLYRQYQAKRDNDQEQFIRDQLEKVSLSLF